MPAVLHEREQQPLLAKKSKKAKGFPITVHPPLSSLEADDESLYIKDEHDLDEYFEGPMKLGGHSRFPDFMRIHGSILPKMLIPLLCVGLWSTAITHLAETHPEIIVSNVLLSILGFVVALALSFRSSTAYERYGDGRRVWTQLTLQSRNMVRAIWFHCREREGELGKEDLFSKITAINLILAFSVSLKHRLRFEPHSQYPDMKDLIKHLHTFAHEAFDNEITCHKSKTRFSHIFGEYLDISFAKPNPREALKHAKKPLGNLPLEILNYLSVWIQCTTEAGNLQTGMAASTIWNGIESLTGCLTESERVLNTPLPIAYKIAFSQITLIYIYTLPFQLYSSLGYLTIPGTIVAAYIILGISVIGGTLENPFGSDTNDLPLDSYCQELAAELDCIVSKNIPKMSDFVVTEENLVLHPISRIGFKGWMGRSQVDIRDALKAKSLLSGRKTLKNGVRHRVSRR